jgi:hypothetical protein
VDDVLIFDYVFKNMGQRTRKVVLSIKYESSIENVMNQEEQDACS